MADANWCADTGAHSANPKHLLRADSRLLHASGPKAMHRIDGVWARQRLRLTSRLIQSEARHAPLTLNQPSEPHELATRVRQRVQRLITALHVPEGGPGVIASRKLDQSQAPTSYGGRRSISAPEPVRSGNGHRNGRAVVALAHRERFLSSMGS